MIGCLWTHVPKQPIIALYFEDVFASSQSLRFILSLKLYSSFITSGPGLEVIKLPLDLFEHDFILLINVRMSRSYTGREEGM